MNKLPFGKLPAYRPRRFVPVQTDLGDWTQIAPLFDQLQARAADCDSPDALEQWLLDWGELSAALDEESTRRRIAMTCHTDDAQAERDYLFFVDKIEPQLKPRQFQLAKIFCSHPLLNRLPKQRYQMFILDKQTQVELYRPENVPLETEETKLSQQYQKLTGSLTVQFRGQEKTLTQMARYLEEPDRPLRQQAWELVAARRLQERDKFDEIFDQQLKLRHQIALNAGFSNYRDYAFRALRRFDYGPAECAQFHDAIELEIMPVLRQLQSQRRSKLDLPALRPWDLAVDPQNRPPLRPFEEVSQLVEGTQRIFDRVDPDFGSRFSQMRDRQLLDLDNRKAKAPGGYQSNLNEARLPFIFMNAVGLQRDVETLLHEGGHAFHAFATQQEELFAYRSNIPIEFCEVASMSMELLGNEFLTEFYSEADAARARRAHLETIVSIFPWIATVDAFQHWIYTHPDHSRQQRRDAWTGLMRRFAGDVDWSGLEQAQANLWHRQLHIFLHPFYYIEYGIAQLGALQVWLAWRRDRAAAIAAYKQALVLGGARPLPQLFKAAGCRFAFSREAVRPVARFLKSELEKLK